MKRAHGKSDFYKLLIRRAFGWRFWCSVCLICMAFFLDTDPEARNVLLGVYEPQGYVGISFYLQNILLYGNNFRLYLAIMTTGYVMSIPDEWHAGMVPYTVSKMGTGRYAAAQVMLGALNGGLAAACGFGLYIAVMALKFPLLPQDYDTNAIHDFLKIMPYYGGLSADIAGRFVSCVLLIFFLSGAAWNALAAGCAVLLKNRYFVFLFPYLLSRGYVELAKALLIPADLRIDRWFEAMAQPFPIPVCLLLLALFSSGICILSVCILYRTLKWRMENGWN